MIEYGLPYTKLFVYANNYFTVRKAVCVRYNVRKNLEMFL